MFESGNSSASPSKPNGQGTQNPPVRKNQISQAFGRLTGNPESQSQKRVAQYYIFGGTTFLVVVLSWSAVSQWRKKKLEEEEEW